MSDLRIGFVGTGMIGREHINRITNKLHGGKVVAVTDINLDGATQVAAQIDARVEKSSQSLIESPDVDAIVVTSWGPAHAESVLQAIAAKKPVFCEKPLATTAADCRRIVDAEIASGKHLVQVGFMRRYDKGYQQVKGILDSGEVGAPLMLHCAHRAESVDKSYTTDMAVTDTAIHEIDVLHWLTNDQYVSAQVILPGSTRHTHDKLRDPQIMILRTSRGIHIDVEVFVNCGFGYDIECEVCCEDAIVRMPEPSFPLIRKDYKRSVEIETDWKRRFGDAYDTEVQDWINAAQEGVVRGPDAWDGYLAAVTADALVKAQTSGKVEPIDVPARLPFYNH